MQIGVFFSISGGFMKRSIGTLSILIMLSACTTPYQPVPFDRVATKTTDIQVVEDAMPDQADIRKLATNGQNIASATSGLGLAGLAVGLVAAGVEANIAAGQREKLRKALESQNFDAEKIFDEAFEAALKSLNYNISVNNTKREKNREFVVTSAQVDAPIGTAVLDIAGNSYGYQLAGGNTSWRPYVVISVKMKDAKDPTKILLDNRVEYNAVAPVPLTVSIPGDPEYGFAKIEDIEANPAKVAEGLKKAIIESANETAKLLR